MKSRRKVDWVLYKKLCKEDKSAISKAKFQRCELYERLGTKEGEEKVYRLAMIRKKRSEDF